MSKKRKFVADGIFFEELNEVLTRELAPNGYSGVEVCVTPMRTEIIIRATHTRNVLGNLLFPSTDPISRNFMFWSLLDSIFRYRISKDILKTLDIGKEWF
ncbi:hypothetical protein J5N97_014372 [Dioscorea zingiberensis]|uniref:Uncharacterized protein n=1 Tax=Dioscorea zingiberensis TaxID=325984 RepID=A0A9D5CTC0_9LILI|nr:hypothetical protein J5N97_014372 [Dioscorea zingiberensis]